MCKYRKKLVVISAHQWFKNGDHPDDNCVIDLGEGPYQEEGNVVRYYRVPGVESDSCKKCHITLDLHGWIDTLESGHVVCPGDWIITGIQGKHYPCKPDIFEATYERI